MAARLPVPGRERAANPAETPGLTLAKLRQWLTDEPPGRAGGWREAWPDALAFLTGLALAWTLDWQAKDLVWSLWLASLVIGYAMIVWTIFGRLVLTAWEAHVAGTKPVAAVASGAVMLTGSLFVLAFFTVHFGLFHFVHSVFLNGFFPVTEQRGLPGLAGYLEVARSYGVFVLVAAVAERHAFTRPVVITAADRKDVAVTAEAIRRRKARHEAMGGAMMVPYKNVIRLHLLIFFFAFASVVKLDNFLVYAVVSAVYFFPWRLLGKRARAT